MFSGKNLSVALKEMKEQSGLTINQIAERCGSLPPSTISRVISGQTDNPTIQTLYEIVVVGMGGSLDALFGINSPLSGGEKNMYERLLAEKDKEIQLINAEHDKAVKYKNKWIVGLFIVAVIAVCISTAYLIWDITHRGVGAFQ